MSLRLAALHLEKQLRQPVVQDLGGKQKHPFSVDQGQDERAPTPPAQP